MLRFQLRKFGLRRRNYLLLKFFIYLEVSSFGSFLFLIMKLFVFIFGLYLPTVWSIFLFKGTDWKCKFPNDLEFYSIIIPLTLFYFIIAFIYYKGYKLDTLTEYDDMVWLADHFKIEKTHFHYRGRGIYDKNFSDKKAKEIIKNF